MPRSGARALARFSVRAASGMSAYFCDSGFLNFNLVVPKNADKVLMDAFSGVTIASPGGNDAKIKCRVRVAPKGKTR